MVAWAGLKSRACLRRGCGAGGYRGCGAGRQPARCARQAQQAECFGSVARVLDPGGVFVIECFVPDLARFDHDQRVQARAVSEDSAVIEVSRHDRVRQRVDTQMITFDGQGMHLRPVAIRYSWPAELDLMAGQAGLRLAERYAGWDRQPFTAASDRHVSVYRRA